MAAQAIEVLGAIILALIPIVTPFVLRWLTTRVGAERMEQFKTLVGDVVNAAELLGAQSGWTGEKKKEWAVAELSRLTSKDPVTISTFIEQAIYRFKTGWHDFELTTNGDGKVAVRKTGGES